MARGGAGEGLATAKGRFEFLAFAPMRSAGSRARIRRCLPRKVLLEGDSVGRGDTEDLALSAACRRPSLDTQFYALAFGVPVDKRLVGSDRPSDLGPERSKKARLFVVGRPGTPAVGIPRVSEQPPLKCGLAHVA